MLQTINKLIFSFRLQELHENSIRGRPRLGGIATSNLAFLRERVERQRSVVVSERAKTGSLENLNYELRNDVENTRNSVERLDTQISTLHQDVATLSMEVSCLCVGFCVYRYFKTQ